MKRIINYLILFVLVPVVLFLGYFLYQDSQFEIISIIIALLACVPFFIHFEKNKECSGELKGEAIIRTATTAEYNRDGDPCKLKFIFSGGYVSLKEEEGCGSYRPLDCSFDLRFPKKKEIKPKKSGKKK